MQREKKTINISKFCFKQFDDKRNAIKIFKKIKINKKIAEFKVVSLREKI